MHNIDLIMTLTVGLSFALILGYVTYSMGLSPIVGYLLAGVALGPHTPGFVGDRAIAEQLAEVGVILLMFGVGLQFHIKELLAVRRIAVPGAIGQSAVATLLGMMICALAGWHWSAGVVYGIAISVASTVVLTRVLADQNALHTQRGHIAVGWLVVEDLFTVIVLVLLPALFPPAATATAAAPSLWLALLLAGLKMTLLVLFTFVVGVRVIPWILSKVAATRSRELFTLTVLVIALGIAVGSYKLFGASMALGAFLAGMVVGRSDFSLRAASEALPMRDAFAVLFFVSVGMLFDPQHLLDEPMFVLGTLLVVTLGKPLAALFIVRAMGYPVRTALSVAVVLGQIGEFSFILATLGIQLKVLPDVASHSLVAASIISISINPLLYRAVGPIEAWMQRRPRVWRWLNKRNQALLAIAADATEQTHVVHLEPARRAVVVGYGPVGQTVTRLLRENDITPTIIELNLDTVHRLRQEGIPAIYGDAGQRDILTAAGLEQSGTLIFTTPSIGSSDEIIRMARELNPRIRVLARTLYVREIRQLCGAGVNTVFSGEGEVAMAMTEAVLRDLGATHEQIDRERERVREELQGTPPFPPASATATIVQPADPPPGTPGS